MMSLDLDKLFTREFEKENGELLEISQSAVGDVGCVVWDAAIVLASYLDTDGFAKILKIANKNVLELGAGTGLVGLQAAANGASPVVITDLPDFVPLIQLNINNNQKVLQGKASARELNWGQDVSSFVPHPDLILIADCVYYEESIESLVTSLTQLSGPETVVLCCFEERTSGNKPALQKKFFELVGRHFEVEEVPLADQHPRFRSEDIHIMKFTPKR